MNKDKFVYKTLEQQIQELWESRSMTVETIEVKKAKGKGVMEWKVTAVPSSYKEKGK